MAGEREKGARLFGVESLACPCAGSGGGGGGKGRELRFAVCVCSRGTHRGAGSFDTTATRAERYRGRGNPGGTTEPDSLGGRGACGAAHRRARHDDGLLGGNGSHDYFTTRGPYAAFTRSSVPG